MRYNKNTRKNRRVSSKVHLSVVVPVYEAKGFLRELCRRLEAVLSSITENYEIVLVEDCSSDGSWDLIREIAGGDKRIKAIRLSRNFGQHYAITAGLDHSRGDWVVVMDCDLQDRPEEIPKLYAKAMTGFDVVLASRTGRRDGWIKKLFSWLFFQVFNYMTGLKYDGKIGNFSIISRKVVWSVTAMRERLRLFGGLLNWVGFPVAKVAVEHAPSARGKSSYTIRKLFRLGIEAVIAYTDKPLWLAVRLGFFMAFVSLLIGGSFFIRAFYYQIAVTGWASLIVSIYFLGGIIIGILGMVGIYVGKTFDEVKNRPLYLTRETVNIPFTNYGDRAS
ncbi:MAG: glycosyltransferase family 2 protein [bacterium]